jgi:membrane protease YdiL (CAAX protease family)
MPIFISLGTLGPFVACYLAHRLCDGNWRAVRLLPGHRSQWLWLLLGPLLIVFCFFVVFPGLISEGEPSAWRWRPRILIGIVVPMFNYNLLGGPLFEEFGWRGFLQSRLQHLMPEWIAAICVGAFWAAWHVPLFLLKGWSSASPAAYLLIIAGVAMVMAYGFNASGRSVSVAILMHSAFNSSPRFIGPYLDDTSTRNYPGGEWYLAAAFLLTAVALVIVSRGRLTTAPTNSR